MPAANVEQLRIELDQFARRRLTLADFDPILELDSELSLTDITPDLYQVLVLLEPYGMANPEPVFAARGAQLVAPPKILKEKHVKLKVRAGQTAGQEGTEELSAAAILAMPRCHPDSAGINRTQREAAVAETQGLPMGRDFRSKIAFDALGWHMAERMQKAPLLAGDSIDIAFSIGHNDHPEYGGIELSLRDIGAAITTNNSGRRAVPLQR